MSLTRAPRCLMLVNGQQISPIECNVHISIHQSADTFYAKLPILPAFGLDESFWSGTAPIPIEIKGVNDINSASFSSLLTGNVDAAQLIMHERAVALRGRDNTSTLTETKTTQLWPNQTDEQVITSLAAQAGLSVQFNGTVATSGLDLDAGYYQELSDQDSAWNVIVFLARQAGCIAFVKGTALYVQPIDAAPPNGMFTVNFELPTAQSLSSSTATMLFATHNLTLAKNTTITVQSWQQQQGQAITSTYNSKPKNASADKMIYTHRAANLTKQQQDRIAAAHLKDTLSHEREIRVDNYPGDVSAVPGLMGLTLSGTGTEFDQNYVFSDAVHHFSNDGGYTMDLAAHSQDSSRGEPTQVQ